MSKVSASLTHLRDQPDAELRQALARSRDELFRLHLGQHTNQVTSSNMDKTATVTVIRRVRDRRFHKFLTRRVKYHVHDEHNTAKVGDVVEIVESRPMSKTKRWRLLSTLSRAVEAETQAPHGKANPDHPQAEK